MEWASVISLIGTLLSGVGAYISFRQSKNTERAKVASEAAKEASEAAKDKIAQNIQYEDITKFQNKCDKFIHFHTLIETCKQCGIMVKAYLTYVLSELNRGNKDYACFILSAVVLK